MVVFSSIDADCNRFPPPPQSVMEKLWWSWNTQKAPLEADMHNLTHMLPLSHTCKHTYSRFCIVASFYIAFYMRLSAANLFYTEVIDGIFLVIDLIINKFKINS